MRKIFLVMILAGMGLPGLYAQADSVWTLDLCVDYAIQYNLGMKRQELMLQSATQDVKQSKLNLLPNLNGSYEHQLGTGRVLDRGTYQWVNSNVSQGDLGLQSDLTIFDGLQNLNNMKMSKASYMMNMEDLQAMEDNLTLEVMTNYLNMLRNQELVEVAGLNVEVTEQQVERMERLVEVGNEPKGRLLEVKAQLSDVKLIQTQAISTMQISRLNLKHLMNITDQHVFEIEKPDFPEPSEADIPSLDSVYQYALNFLPQIKSAEYGIETQERYLAMQQGQRSPRIYARGMLYSNYSDGLVNPLDPDPSNPTMDYPVYEQVNNNQYKQIAMGLQIPFFNRWQVQTGIKKAKLSLQDAEYEHSNTVLELQKAIQQYHTEAVSALDSYKSAQESVANSDEAYRFAEERFRVGTGTALELQQARRQLFEASSQMISSRYVLIFYTKILDFYMGKGIVF
ncbi:MAG: TolC family protein [Bacteroides sp.]|nr:TolC family protein [Bacteroides sp.]